MPVDPYAPPPMHHDRSGALVRLAILAALIAGGAWAYFQFSGQETASLVPPPAAQEQTLADASQDLPPDATPEAEPAPVAPRTAAPAARPAPRTPATQVAPPPIVAPEPAPSTPIPPDGMPPAG